MLSKSKLRELAKIMVNYSVFLKKDEKLVIKARGFETLPLVKEVYKEALNVGALKVKVDFSNEELNRIFYENATDKQLTYVSENEEDIADSYDAMIQIVGGTNPYELNQIDPSKMQMHSQAWKSVSDIMIEKKWCLFYYPNPASAALAKKPLEEWEDFVMDSCIVDWEAEAKMQRKFIEILKEVKFIHVTGEETDITFGVDGQIWRVCAGTHNLPDGEVYTSPIRTKVDGVIRYNIPTIYRSKEFQWIKLTYKNGEVVDSESNNKKALDEILDTDEGSRFLGELAFGLNENIQTPTKQILFDEKMGRSMHTALGRCYTEAPNGNDSIIHWDLIFRFPESDAKVFFDEVLVYEKGKWIDLRLLFLNR